MQLTQSPETIMLIHRTMVREALERHDRQRQEIEPRHRPIVTIRLMIGRSLISLGTRIAPAGRPNTARPVVGGMSIAH